MTDKQYPKSHIGIMLSSTFSDLIEERDNAKDLLIKYGFFPDIMENDSAKSDEDVIESSLTKVRNSAVYFAIITNKYGTICKDANRNPNELSLTELEFDEAVKLNRSIYLFIMGENNKTLAKHIETDKTKIKKLKKFKEKAKGGSGVARVYANFNNIDEFKEKLQQSLADVQKKNANNSNLYDLEERIDFLEKNICGGFKLDKNYMGIIMPRVGDKKYKIYVYKEFTLLKANESIRCRVHINNKQKIENPSLSKEDLNLSAYISLSKCGKFSKCEKIDEISIGEEYLQFQLHFKQDKRNNDVKIEKGGTVAIFYTYDVNCAHYGNELVRKTSVFTESDLMCELVYPKKNEEYYDFTFVERNEQIELDTKDSTECSEKSILYDVQKSESFQEILNNLFPKEKNYCYRQVDYQKCLKGRNKPLQEIYALVAEWNFIPFFTDPDMYLTMERYINDGSPSGFTKIRNTHEKYTPYSKKTTEFNIVGVSIQNNCTDYGNKPEWLDEKEILIHPEYNDCPFAKNKVSTHTVIPTASSRTVFISDKKCYAKLQYNNLIGRLERVFSPEKIDNAVKISEILKEKFDDGVFSNDLFFLPENFGRIIDFGSNHKAKFEKQYLGMIIRDYKPYPDKYIKDIQWRLIPSFSLFSKEYKDADFSKSILELLFDFRNEMQLNYETFLLEKIIKPVFKLYFELLIETGLHIEGHSQNILYLISINKNKLDVVGAVVRDFESFDKDTAILKKRGLYSEFRNLEEKINSPGTEKYIKRNSFLFDFKLGEYLITPLLEHSCKIKKDFDKGGIIETIKEFNKQYIEQLEELSPNFYPQDKWWSYDNVEIDRSKDDRPWIENSKEKNNKPLKYR